MCAISTFILLFGKKSELIETFCLESVCFYLFSAYLVNMAEILSALFHGFVPDPYDQRADFCSIYLYSITKAYSMFSSGMHRKIAADCTQPFAALWPSADFATNLILSAITGRSLAALNAEGMFAAEDSMPAFATGRACHVQC